MKHIYRILGSVVIVLYFLISILTLHQYGVNWDEVEHLTRGQAYLHFFLTGNERYNEKVFQEGARNSFYQIPQYDFAKWQKIDAGHPVISDILSSAFNYVFYQQLGIINDFDAYHLYGPVLVALFCIFLFFWVEKYFGGFTAFVSVISLLTYPLFYGESHFNVQKDIPETVFYSTAIMTFFIGYTQKSVKWIILSALFFGFAWGTKFNILFMPLVLLLWLVAKERMQLVKKLWRLSPGLKISLILYPFIGFSIFFFSWPYLWHDSVNNIVEIFGYYRDIGAGSVQSMPSSYYVFGFNTYAAQWIIFTTPVNILLFSIIGIVYVIKRGLRDKSKISFLILFWFLLPILRVSLPNTSIYGGVRQIMEYIPAFAILAGIGANYLVQLLNSYIVSLAKQFNNTTMQQLSKRKLPIVQVLILLSFIPIILKIISLHPFESIYFNELIGGLKGAMEKNIPGWGNSLGNPYRQGKYWINDHAEKNAKVALRFENVSNIPKTMLREDIKYSNIHRSGPLRKGEYVIGVDHYGTQKEYYHYKYLERFLDPVYVVRVDGVPVLKVWKNDLAHTKLEFRKKETEIKDITIKKPEDSGRVIVDFSRTVRLTKLVIEYEPENCIIPTDGKIHMSEDEKSWITLPGSFLDFPGFAWFQPDMEKGKLQYLFAADNARFVLLTGNTQDSCLLKNSIRVKAWEM